MISQTIKIFHAKSFPHLVLIFCVFAVTGSSSVIVTEPIMKFINLKSLIDFYPIYLIVKILLVLVFYNVLLIFFGTLVGQFAYFSNMQKKFLRRIKIIK